MSTPEPLAIPTETAAPPLDLQLGLGSLAWANAMPLWHRLGRGEGLLFAVNLSLIAVAQSGPLRFAEQTIVSIAVLTLLYLVNDVMDAPRDVHDAGKNQVFVRFCLRRRQSLAWLIVAEHAAVAGLAYALLGPRSAIGVIAVALVNLAYSGGLKGRAFLDVPWVALWGGTYVMVTGLALPISVLAIVGLMTSVAHVFQITRDRSVDTLNEIRTSAVALPWLPRVQMALVCLAMGACIAEQLGALAGLSAAIPFVLYVSLRSNQLAWLSAKLYFAAVWIAVLAGLHVA